MVRREKAFGHQARKRRIPWLFVTSVRRKKQRRKDDRQRRDELGAPGHGHGFGISVAIWLPVYMVGRPKRTQGPDPTPSQAGSRPLQRLSSREDTLERWAKRETAASGRSPTTASADPPWIGPASYDAPHVGLSELTAAIVDVEVAATMHQCQKYNFHMVSTVYDGLVHRDGESRPGNTLPRLGNAMDVTHRARPSGGPSPFLQDLVSGPLVDSAVDRHSCYMVNEKSIAAEV